MITTVKKNCWTLLKSMVVSSEDLESPGAACETSPRNRSDQRQRPAVPGVGLGLVEMVPLFCPRMIGVAMKEVPEIPSAVQISGGMFSISGFAALTTVLI